MISIFHYSDFRKFLKDSYLAKKAQTKGFNYQFIAQQANFKSLGLVTQLFQGKTKLSDAMIPRIADVFGLTTREKSFFTDMVHYNQAVKHTKKKYHYERMLRYEEAAVVSIPKDHYEILDKWYYTAIRAILSFYKFNGDYSALAKMVQPSIFPSEAKKAISVLERLGMIKRDEDGFYKLTSLHLTTEGLDCTMGINNYVINSLEIARDSLHRFEKTKRSLSALSLSVSKEGFDEMVGEIEDFRKRIVDISKRDRHVDRVYQLNMQFFPISAFDDKESDS